MSKRFVVVFFLSLIVIAVARASGAGVVGIVTRVEPSTIEVKTDNGQVHSVTVNAKTTYMEGFA